MMTHTNSEPPLDLLCTDAQYAAHQHQCVVLGLAEALLAIQRLERDIVQYQREHAQDEASRRSEEVSLRKTIDELRKQLAAAQSDLIFQQGEIAKLTSALSEESEKRRHWYSESEAQADIAMHLQTKLRRLQRKHRKPRKVSRG